MPRTRKVKSSRSGYSTSTRAKKGVSNFVHIGWSKSMGLSNAPGAWPRRC
jgi:hypothetical protein